MITRLPPRWWCVIKRVQKQTESWLIWNILWVWLFVCEHNSSRCLFFLMSSISWYRKCPFFLKKYNRMEYRSLLFRLWLLIQFVEIHPFWKREKSTIYHILFLKRFFFVFNENTKSVSNFSHTFEISKNVRLLHLLLMTWNYKTVGSKNSPIGNHSSTFGKFSFLISSVIRSSLSSVNSLSLFSLYWNWKFQWTVMINSRFSPEYLTLFNVSLFPTHFSFKFQSIPVDNLLNFLFGFILNSFGIFWTQKIKFVELSIECNFL